MRGETLQVEGQVCVAGIGWLRPGRHSGLLNASVECGQPGIEAFVMPTEPVRLRC